jgi:hypothetical protein
VTVAPAAAAPRALRAARLAFAALALLVAASVVTLFHDQAVKGQPPLVRRQGGVTHFAPGLGGCGHRGHPACEAHIHLEVTTVDVLDVSVQSARSGRVVAVIASHIHRKEYRLFRLEWDGRTAAGTLAAPGGYLVSVHFERRNQTVIVPGFELHLEGPHG